ncbi:MAG: hypothetical protein DI607_14290, partial [Sphingomonas hengshuiensis]
MFVAHIGDMDELSFENKELPELDALLMERLRLPASFLDSKAHRLKRSAKPVEIQAWPPIGDIVRLSLRLQCIANLENIADIVEQGIVQRVASLRAAKDKPMNVGILQPRQVGARRPETG